MNSVDCASSLSTLRSIGGELEYDLWEGQFAFGHALDLPINSDSAANSSAVVHFFKNELSTLVDKVHFYSFITLPSHFVAELSRFTINMTIFTCKLMARAPVVLSTLLNLSF